MAMPKIPIDVKALTKAGKIFESDASEDALIEVWVDTSASRELVSLARKVLQVKPGTLELSIKSLAEEMPRLNTEASLTIVVAGSSPHLRRLMEIALWSSMNCLVLSEDPAALIARVAEEDALEIAHTILEVDTSKPQEALEKDLAQWCIANLPDLRLSLGAAFEFMRKPIALDLTRQTSLENAVIAAVFFLPGADLPLLTLNQCKLLYQIAVTNDIPITRDRLVELALVIASAFGLRGISRLALKKFAPVGWLVRGGISFGATMLMGHLAYTMYSKGGGVVDIVKEKMGTGQDDDVLNPEEVTEVAASPEALTQQISTDFQASEA